MKTIEITCPECGYDKAHEISEEWPNLVECENCGHPIEYCSGEDSRSSTGSAPLEVAWLVEKGPTDFPLYLCVKHYDWAWTRNPYEAIRFARKEDAELIPPSFLGSCTLMRTVEHGWEPNK